MEPGSVSVPAAGSARVGKGVLLAWLGQLISLSGSQVARFALIFWAYEQTERATVLALLSFSLFAPSLLLSPVAGAMVDRFDQRRLLIALSLASAGISSFLLALALADRLAVWHLYVAGGLSGAVQAVSFPALSAVVARMVPRRHLGRAGGMLSLAQSSAAILGPPLGALLLPVFGLAGVLTVDVATFLAAMGGLLLVEIPPVPPEGGPGGGASRPAGNLLLGFRYFAERPGARALQIVFLATNLLGSLAPILLAPAVLARSGQDKGALGLVQSSLGMGGLAGGALLALWGGPRRRRVLAVLAAILLSTGAGQIALGIGRTPAAWAVAAFVFAFFLPISNGLSMAIWQTHVPPALQGRVFAAARVMAQAPLVLAFLLAGPLADHVFEPALAPGTPLAASLGWLVGEGAGAGMGLLFVASGLLGGAVAAFGCTVPLIRQAEERWDG